MNNNNIIDLKNEYHLNIIFYKKSNSFLTSIYKTLFFKKYCHISFNLDGFHNLNTFFNVGTILYSSDIKEILFELDVDMITLILNEKEYYNILDTFNELNGCKYNYFALFNYLKKYNIINNKSLVCTEISSIILKKLNININNVFNVDMFYNNLLKKLTENNIKYLNYKG